jgi:hypothetical protein
VEPDVGYEDVSVVSYEVFNNGFGAVDNVDVSPVHPTVVGLESS